MASSPYVKLIDNDPHPIKTLDLSLRGRRDSEMSSLAECTPYHKNSVPLPNQSNAFFASGGHMIDPTGGELEVIYSQARSNKLQFDSSI